MLIPNMKAATLLNYQRIVCILSQIDTFKMAGKLDYSMYQGLKW